MLLLNLSLSQGFGYGKTVPSIRLGIFFVPILQTGIMVRSFVASVAMSDGISQ